MHAGAGASSKPWQLKQQDRRHSGDETGACSTLSGSPTRPAFALTVPLARASLSLPAGLGHSSAGPAASPAAGERAQNLPYNGHCSAHRGREDKQLPRAVQRSRQEGVGSTERSGLRPGAVHLHRSPRLPRNSSDSNNTDRDSVRDRHVSHRNIF